LIFLKGMGDVFQISQEYLEESLGERTMIGADKFPLKSYSVLESFNEFMDNDHNSFLNTMFLRYVFRIELAMGIQNQLRLGRGNKNVNLKMLCTPDQASQIFDHVDVKKCVRNAMCDTTRSVVVVDPPRCLRIDADVKKVVADVTQPQMLCELLGDEYYRYIVAGAHYQGDVGRWDLWNASRFSAISPVGARKFTVEYDTISCTLHVNADVTRLPNSLCRLDYEDYESTHKEKLLGRRVFDVDHGEYFWVVDVVYTTTTFHRKGDGRRKDERRSTAALVSVNVSEDEGCFDECMNEDGSIRLEYFSNVKRDKHCFSLDVKHFVHCSDSGNWIIPGGKRGDGSRDVIEKPPPKKKVRSDEYLRGMKVKEYFKDFNVSDSYGGEDESSKKMNVCLKWFFNTVKENMNLVTADKVCGVVEDAILRFDSYKVDEWKEYLSHVFPDVELFSPEQQPGNGRSRAAAIRGRREVLTSAAKALVEHIGSN
jgi:hypothetical protein